MDKNAKVLTIPTLALISANVKAVTVVGDYVSRLPFLYGEEIDSTYVDDLFCQSDPDNYLKFLKNIGYNTINIPVYLDIAFPTSPTKLNEPYVQYLNSVKDMVRKQKMNVVFSFPQRHFSRRLGGYGLPDWCLPESILEYFRGDKQIEHKSELVTHPGRLQDPMGEKRVESTKTVTSTTVNQVPQQPNKAPVATSTITQTDNAAGISSFPDMTSVYTAQPQPEMNNSTVPQVVIQKDVHTEADNSISHVSITTTKVNEGKKRKCYYNPKFNRAIAEVLAPIREVCNSIASSAELHKSMADHKEGKQADGEEAFKMLNPYIYGPGTHVDDTTFAKTVSQQLDVYLKKYATNEEVQLYYGQLPMPLVTKKLPKQLAQAIRKLEKQIIAYLVDNNVQAELYSAFRTLANKLCEGTLAFAPMTCLTTTTFGDDGYTTEYDTNPLINYLEAQIRTRIKPHLSMQLKNLHTGFVSAVFDGSSVTQKPIQFYFNNLISPFTEKQRGLNVENKVAEIKPDVAESCANELMKKITHIPRPLILTILPEWEDKTALIQRFLVHVLSVVLPSPFSISDVCSRVHLYSLLVDVHFNCDYGISPCTTFLGRLTGTPIGWFCGSANSSVLTGHCARINSYFDIKATEEERQQEKLRTDQLTRYAVVTQYPHHHQATELFHSGIIILAGSQCVSGLFIQNFGICKVLKKQKKKREASSSSDNALPPAPESLAIMRFNMKQARSISSLMLSEAALVQTAGLDLMPKMSFNLIGSTDDDSVMKAIKDTEGMCGVFASAETEIGAIVSVNGKGIPIKVGEKKIQTVTVDKGQLFVGVHGKKVTGAAMYECSIE